MPEWWPIGIAFLFGVLVGMAMRRKRHRTDEVLLPLSSPQELEARVREMAARGERLRAIKLYRDFYDVDLKDAKAGVEALTQVGSQPSSQSPSAELEARARELVMRGQTIQAIKLYRQFTTLDLKAAKDAVEALARALPPPRSPSG